MENKFFHGLKKYLIWIGIAIVLQVAIISLVLNFSQRGRANYRSKISSLDSLNVRKIAFWPALHAYKPVVRGDTCYLSVSSRIERLDGVRGKIQVLDVSNPFRPTLLGETPTDTVERDYRYFLIKGNYAYISDIRHGLRIFDLLASPALKEISLWEKGRGPSGLDVARGYAFLAMGSRGLFILDVRNPYHPREVYHLPCSLSRYDFDYMLSARVHSHYLYVGTRDSLLILDISDVTHPFRVSALGFERAFFEWVLAIETAGKYIYTCGSHFHVIDISDPYQPVEVASLKSRWGWRQWLWETKRDILIKEDYAYIAEGKWLWVVDIHDPHSPMGVGYYDTDLWLCGIDVAGDYIYIAGSTEEVGGMYILEFMGNVGKEATTTIPNRVRILQNYPNPFRSRTQISYALPRMARAKFFVYNLLGQQVYTAETEVKTAGYHTFLWDAGDLPPGLYFFRVSALGQSAVRKIILLR